MTLEVITPIILILCLALGWFVFEQINKRTTFLSKKPWIVIALFPFIPFILIGAIMLLCSVEWLIIIIAAGSVLCFLLAGCGSTSYHKYKKRITEKEEMYKARKTFGYQSNKDQVMKKTSKEKKGEK